MKIVYLAAGAGGMYCGTCLHDNTLAAALRDAGADVLLVPTYTPLKTDETNVSYGRVFFGGINVYLQQKLSLFRHTPWWFDRLLDTPGLLQAATARSISGDPAKLGDLTVSILQGEEGNQRKELAKLVAWLANDVQPDVVHLSNSILVGLARELRRLEIPILCSLSGEDIFLEKLAEPHYGQARHLLRERAADIDAFVALNHYFADFMAEYLSADRARIHVVPHGLKLEGHAARPARTDDNRTIGYMARVAPEKGLHRLVEAFIALRRDPDVPPVRLRVAGYMASTDRGYLARLEEELRRAGLFGAYEYAGELDRQEKIAFLQSLDVFCLPTVYHESKGLSVFEAWANAVAAVLPAHGAFPEMVNDTGGGLLYDPDSPNQLVAALKRLVNDRGGADELGRRGRAAVCDRYHDDEMARQTLRLYRQLCGITAAPLTRATRVSENDDSAEAGISDDCSRG